MNELYRQLANYGKPPDLEWLSLLSKVAPTLPTLVPLLPVMLSLEGKPYTLRNHFFFEPLFETVIPPQQIWRTARQLGKSMSLAARGVVMSAARSHFRTLYVTPLQDQSFRFSNDYFAPLIEDSPIRPLLHSDSRTGSVLRRAFRNRSVSLFLYAWESPRRIRGISARMVCIDETQDMDQAHIPVIKECMSSFVDASIVYAGTSLTRDTTLEGFYEQSSMAEWVTRCQACNYYNIAALEHDLEKMIGPYREDISAESPAVLCARCRRSIFPETGRWEHRHPDKIGDFAGYHIPQPIVPSHYRFPSQWKKLLGKQRGLWGYTRSKYVNEVLGEPSDDAVKLVSKTDLEKAGILHRNVEVEALGAITRYAFRVLAVDWGGGGLDGASRTALAVMGVRPDGAVEVVFGKKLLSPDDHIGEARECLRLYQAFQCHKIVHDFGGAGDIRETLLIQAGVRPDAIVPIMYVPPHSRDFISYVRGDQKRSRSYWTVDKSRSLQLTCWAIKLDKMFFFKYDYLSAEEPGLLHDFTSLTEQKVPTARGSDLYAIVGSPRRPDDFAQAVNIGAVVLWHLTGAWPDFAKHITETGWSA